MEEWKEYKYTELANIIGGGTPKTAIKEYWNGNIPWLSVKDFGNDDKYVYTTEKTITELGLSNSSTNLLQKEDIIISARGTVGELAMIPFPMSFNQSCFGIRAKENVNPHFLYYLTKTKIKELKNNSHGSVFDTITRATFENIICNVPKLDEQKRIADFLSSLDDKIELNRQINDNLEQQAQALFKSWFVDFEPFKDGEFIESELGMIPKGWRVGNIGDYCKNRSGYAFKSSWWTDNGVKIIKIRNITESGTLDMSDCSHVLSHNCEKAVDFKALTGDLIIAMTGATIGKFCIIPKHSEEYYINQRVGKFFLGNKPLEKLPFIHCLLKMESISADIINKGQGSAQPNISGSDIESTRIIFPPENIIDSFNRLLKPYYEKLIHNTSNNSSIENLRDTLLPRLMSGELKINEINC